MQVNSTGPVKHAGFKKALITTGAVAAGATIACAYAMGRTSYKYTVTKDILDVDKGLISKSVQKAPFIQATVDGFKQMPKLFGEINSVITNKCELQENETKFKKLKQIIVSAFTLGGLE